MAAVFGVSIPFPLFNNGKAAVAQARAQTRSGAGAASRRPSWMPRRRSQARRPKSRMPRRPRATRAGRRWRRQAKPRASPGSATARASSASSTCSMPSAPCPKRAPPRSTRSPPITTPRHAWNGSLPPRPRPRKPINDEDHHAGARARDPGSHPCRMRRAAATARPARRPEPRRRKVPRPAKPRRVRRMSSPCPRSRSRTPGSRSRARPSAAWPARSSFRRRSRAIRRACRSCPPPIGGRLVSLTRNLGQSVGRGDPLAIIESREAASLKAEVEAARARSALAQSNLRREQRLFAERVSPEQDLVAARTAATEASIALRLAQQQLSATGSGGGALNRIAVRSPIAGQVIARSATLGQTVAADAELFRVANLSKVTVTTSLVPSRCRPGEARRACRGDGAGAASGGARHVRVAHSGRDDPAGAGDRHARQRRQHMARRRDGQRVDPRSRDRGPHRRRAIGRGADDRGQVVRVRPHRRRASGRCR